MQPAYFVEACSVLESLRWNSIRGQNQGFPQCIPGHCLSWNIATLTPASKSFDKTQYTKTALPQCSAVYHILTLLRGGMYWVVNLWGPRDFPRVREISLQGRISFDSVRNKTFYCNILLAPTGALIVMMVYYISIRGNFFRFSLSPLMQLMLQGSL